jgi:tetratricopeptide (TPR) repeat protein
MLEEPHHINDADAESIRALNETYPYFVPGRYMQAAQQHKNEPFSPEMMGTMQLFSGNWYLYNEYLQEALGGEEVEFNTSTTEKPKKKEIVAEVEEVGEVAGDFEEEAPAVEAEPVETYTGPVQEKQNSFTDGFNPVDTGFVRTKRTTAPPPPAEDIIAEEVTETEKAEPVVKEKTSFKTILHDEKSDNLIPPIYTEDYFLHQGMQVSNDLPEDIGNPDHKLNLQEQQKSLMVVMSFSEWLMYYKKKKRQEEEQEQDQKDLRTMWQKEKLAAALEEENEEIPENVFEMAVNSITKEEGLVSESLAEVLVRQGRYDRAIDMYKKLSLRKPQKKAYFARKIEEILKEK